MLAAGAEAPRLPAGVQGHFFHPLVVDPHQVAVPTDPDLAADIFRRDRVIGLLHLYVPVPVHRPLGFMEERKPLRGQRQQGRAFHLPKDLAHLPAGGAVDAGVGHCGLPLLQVPVLLGQVVEPPAFEAVVLGVADFAFHLALVTRRAGLGGQDHGAIVGGKGQDAGIQFRVEPVGLLDRSLQVIDHQGLGNPAPLPEGVLQGGNEALHGLAEHRLAVGFTGMAQDNAEDVGLSPPAVRANHRRPGAEVHLGFLPGLTFHPPERQRAGGLQMPHEPLYRLVAVGKPMFGPQVLPDALGAQALFEHADNHFLKGGAAAAVRGRCTR